MSEHTVLIVEDDPSIAKLLSHLLEAWDIATDVAIDGLQALEKLHRTTPSLVVLDIALPRVDGWEILSTLQQAGRDVPVVVVTAHGRGDSEQRATRLGARRFFTKPFLPNQLVAAIVELLEAPADD